MDDATLLSAVLKLPVRKREKVAEALIASIKSPSQGYLDRLWAQESEARVDALLARKIKTISGENVLGYRTQK